MKQAPLPRPTKLRKIRPQSPPEPDETSEKYSSVGDMVVGDVFGKFPEPTYSKHHYFVAFKDLASNKVHCYLMKSKDHLGQYLEKLYDEYHRYGQKVSV